jgi:hypothetical protein
VARSALKEVRDAAQKRRRRAFFIVLALILAGIGIWLGTRPQHKAGTAGSADLRAAPPRASVAAAPRVLQYGITGTPGTGTGKLNIPDGFRLVLPGGLAPAYPATG